jgi:hypothetical protein
MNVYIEENLFPGQMKDAESNGVNNFSQKQAREKIEKCYISCYFVITLMSSMFPMTMGFKRKFHDKRFLYLFKDF